MKARTAPGVGRGWTRRDSHGDGEGTPVANHFDCMAGLIVATRTLWQPPGSERVDRHRRHRERGKNWEGVKLSARQLHAPAHGVFVMSIVALQQLDNSLDALGAVAVGIFAKGQQIGDGLTNDIVRGKARLTTTTYVKPLLPHAKAM
jgi:hypothetical protein